MEKLKFRHFFSAPDFNQAGDDKRGSGLRSTTTILFFSRSRFEVPDFFLPPRQPNPVRRVAYVALLWSPQGRYTHKTWYLYSPRGVGHENGVVDTTIVLIRQ